MSLIANYNGTHVEYKKRTDVKRFDINQRVPDVGNFVQVKPDWETARWKYTIRQLTGSYSNDKDPMPATVPCRPTYNGVVYDYVNFPPRWQEWLFGLFKYTMQKAYPELNIPDGEIEYFFHKTATGKEVKIDWKDRENYAKYDTIFAHITVGSYLWAYGNFIQISRALTDGHPPERGTRDVVTKRNMTNPKDYEWKSSLTFCNQLHEIVSSDTKFHKIKALNVYDAPPSYEYFFDHPEFVLWPNEVTTVRLPDGTYVISQFPQLKILCDFYGVPRIATPAPFVTKDGFSYIEKIYTDPVINGEFYSIYNLPK